MVTRSSERIFKPMRYTGRKPMRYTGRKPMRYTGRKPICMYILERIILINIYNIYKKRIV